MLIAVSVKKPELLSDLSDVFGRSVYYLIYNTINNNPEYFQNPYASELGGAGIQAARILIGKNIDILLTRNIGLNPLRLFCSANVKVYQCSAGTANQAIQLFQSNNLKTIDIAEGYFYPGRHRRRCRR